MIPSRREIVRALHGCRLLVLDRPGAIDLFDRSEGGFWRSFFAAVLAFPAFAISDMMYGGGGDGGAGLVAGGFADWIGYGLRYVIYWLIFPLVAVVMAERTGVLERILDFLVPYNWVTVPFSYIFCALYIVGAGDGPFAAFFEWLAVLLWIGLLVLLWRWAQRFLGVSALMAAGFILADEVSSTVAYLVLENIAGLR